MNGILPFAEILLGQVTADCRWRKFPLGRERRIAVARPRGIPANGRLPLLVQVKFLLTADCRYLSKRNFRERHSAVPCPDGIWAIGGMPLLVQREFLLAAPRRQAAMGFSCTDAGKSGIMYLLATAKEEE